MLKKDPFFTIPALFLLLFTAFSCHKEKNGEDNAPVYYFPHEFVMGADLSYVNQILDFNGVYRDSGERKDPYRIFRQYGANVIRFRLFHTPLWTKEIYGEEGIQMYNDLADVALGIRRAKEEGLMVCLDIHYSDNWADPQKQDPPEAWKDLSLEVLKDSLYEYTFSLLRKLDAMGLMPEYVQPGNEINSGFVLPAGNRWEGNEENFLALLNSAILAVRDAGTLSDINPFVILHIAQPENVLAWFNGLEEIGLPDFDIIGFSYYYNWSEVDPDRISNYVALFRQRFDKDIMIMETAYPWTLAFADDYANILDPEAIEEEYPATETGQYEYLLKITQEVMDGGGKGLFYWEPAWITSGLKTQWGQGSCWECNTLFDFEGNVLPGMEYMRQAYHLLP